MLKIVRQVMACFPAFALAALLISCTPDNGNNSADQEQNDGEYVDTEPSPGEPLDVVRIAWDCSSESQVAQEGGYYPRVIALDNGRHIAAYETPEGKIAVRHSNDGCQFWGAAVMAVDSYTKGGVLVKAANAEICQLSDGTLLCGANYRPTSAGSQPWSIAVSRSSDYGYTWTDAEIVYKAGKSSDVGCWEPYFLELPDGTVHLYFANENPYPSSDEQEISCLVSHDKGLTWEKKHKTVSFRSGSRDGMPVARVFGDEIVVAIEDNVDGNFKPYTVRCKVSDAWKAPVLALSDNRMPAHAEELPKGYYAGAPYLLRLPSGEALLSYQVNPAGMVDQSMMEVAIGDVEAKNFGRLSRPFSKSCLWNSICLINENTVCALGTMTLDGRSVPMLKKGHVMKTVFLQDENVSELPIFIGSRFADNMSAGFGKDADHIVFRAEIKDSKVFEGKNRKDGVFLYLDMTDKAWSTPYYGNFKVWVSCTGEAVVSAWDKGRWVEKKSLTASAIRDDRGYSIVLKIPVDLLGNSVEELARVGLTISNYSSEQDGYQESVVDMDANKPCTWLPVSSSKE